MVIFWRLFFGHLLADFTFQSNLVNAWKRKNIWGMLIHCGMHPVAYAILTFPFLNDYWINTEWIQLRGFACILLIFILHFLEDEWRVFSIFKYRTPDNTLYFAVDQMIHYLVIIAFIPMGLADMSQGWFPEKWPVLGCLFVAVTHFTPVFVYFIEKDLFGKHFPGFDEKYIGMAARLVLASCFLLPGYWWIWLVMIWSINMFYMRYRRVFDFSWFNLSMGWALALVFGIASRLIYYA